MVDTETDSHNSRSPFVLKIYDKLSKIQLQPNDSLPEDDLPTSLELHDAIRRVEREWLFNIIFVIIFILILLSLLISCIIVIWGDDWLFNATIKHNCIYAS